MLYGPGVVHFDLSLAKEIKFSESKSLEFRVEAFNAFNHFNPNNPNSGLTYLRFSEPRPYISQLSRVGRPG